MGVFDNTLVTGSEGGSSKVFEQPVKLVNSDGSDFTGGSGTYTLPLASASTLGGVKVGANGSLSVDSQSQQIFISNSGVTTEKIADGAVTSAKLGSDVLKVQRLNGMFTVQSADAAAAAGDAPTKAEFDAVVALANECKKTLNDLRGNLQAANLLAQD